MPPVAGVLTVRFWHCHGRLPISRRPRRRMPAARISPAQQTIDPTPQQPRRLPCRLRAPSDRHVPTLRPEPAGSLQSSHARSERAWLLMVAAAFKCVRVRRAIFAGDTSSTTAEAALAGGSRGRAVEFVRRRFAVVLSSRHPSTHRPDRRAGPTHDGDKSDATVARSKYWSSRYSPPAYPVLALPS